LHPDLGVDAGALALREDDDDRRPLFLPAQLRVTRLAERADRDVAILEDDDLAARSEQRRSGDREASGGAESRPGCRLRGRDIGCDERRGQCEQQKLRARRHDSLLAPPRRDVAATGAPCTGRMGKSLRPWGRGGTRTSLPQSWRSKGPGTMFL